MRLTEASERVFARHETFHPRYGWFRKAYAFVGEDPKIFVSPDAGCAHGGWQEHGAGDSLLGNCGEAH